MNSLSWLIYMSDVLPSLGRAASGLSFFLGLGMVVYTIIWALYNNDVRDNEIIEKRYNSDYKAKYLQFYWKTCALVFTLLVSISIVTPSQRTILLIAASEFGEKAMETEVGSQAIRILKNKLSEIELEQTRKKTQ